LFHNANFFGLFHNANLFGSCIIDILYTECAKIEKNNSGAKRLRKQRSALDCSAIYEEEEEEEGGGGGEGG